MFYSRNGPSINFLGPGQRRFPRGSPAGYPARKVYVYVVFPPLRTPDRETLPPTGRSPVKKIYVYVPFSFLRDRCQLSSPGESLDSLESLDNGHFLGGSLFPKEPFFGSRPSPAWRGSPPPPDGAKIWSSLGKCGTSHLCASTIAGLVMWRDMAITDTSPFPLGCVFLLVVEVFLLTLHLFHFWRRNRKQKKTKSNFRRQRDCKEKIPHRFSTVSTKTGYQP